MGEIQKPPSLARKLQGYAFSLRAALLFTVILGVSVPSALSVYQETQQIRLDSAAALKQDIDRIATLLALAMREPLWQLVPEDADSIMEAASVDPRISGIQVNDHAGAIFAQRYRAAPEGEQTTTVTKTVQRGGAVIGTVSIEMATSGYRKAVEAAMQRRIRQAVGTILVSILIILVVLRYQIGRAHV